MHADDNQIATLLLGDLEDLNMSGRDRVDPELVDRLRR
jgi:hypothetical protein